MPVSYEIDPSRSLVITRAWGTISADDVIKHNAELLGDPMFDRSFQQLADLLQVTEVALSADAVRDFARVDMFAPTSKRALIMSAGHTPFGLVKMYEAISNLVGHQLVRVFTSMSEAVEWLGINRESFQES